MEPRTSLPERLAVVRGAFRERFGREAEGVAEAPGRVNLIGEHLDYNEGWVLPVAIDRGVLVAFGARDDMAVRAYSMDYDGEVSFSLSEPIARDDAYPWSHYVRGVFAVLLAGGHSGRGLDMAITGEVPIGAGLSSSAAVELATAGAVRAAWQLDIGDERLALLCQRAEHEFAGVQCGVMDQLAAALGQEGCALLIDCRTLAHESIPLRLEEQGIELVLVESGVARRLGSSAYNERREECAEAFRLLRDAIRDRAVQSLRDVTLDDFGKYSNVLSPALLRRARHVITEQQRVVDAVEALAQRDHAMLGELMNESHASLRDDFEVSCPELDRLQLLAKSQRGVLGARLTGAGFGGCTVQLVERAALPAFEQDVVGRYRSETGLPARMLVCHAADGLRVHKAAV
jgi:galactokinase